MNFARNCKVFAEVVLNYKQGADFQVVKQDSVLELRIVNNNLRRVHGEVIRLEDVSKCKYCFVLMFFGEQTPLIVKRYRDVAEKLAEFGLESLVYIYDCDAETRTFIRALDRVTLQIPGSSIERALEIASYLVLAKRFVDLIRRSRERAVDEAYYYEYQEALTNFSKYMSKLLRSLGSVFAAEELLEVVKETDLQKSEVLERQFERAVRYYTFDYPGECPSSPTLGLRNILSRVSASGFTCLVVAEPLVRHLSHVAGEDQIVSVNLEV